MLIEAQSGPLRKILAVANSTAAAYPSRVPTVTDPTNDGVLDLAEYAAVAPKQILVIPYGLGSDEDAFSFRVLGWRMMGNTDTPLGDLWVPENLGEFGCTLGTTAGVAGSPVLNTELFVDTITVTTEGTYTAATTRRGATRVYSPADNTVASVVLPLNGCQKVELIFKQTTNTPTMNALVAFGHFD